MLPLPLRPYLKYSCVNIAANLRQVDIREIINSRDYKKLSRRTTGEVLRSTIMQEIRCIAVKLNIKEMYKKQKWKMGKLEHIEENCKFSLESLRGLSFRKNMSLCKKVSV